jgi:hypothetical protein
VELLAVINIPRSQQGHGDDEPSALKHIAQGHQEQQACGIAELGCGDNKASLIGRKREGAGNRIEQRLRVIVAGDGKTGGDGHERDQRRAKPMMLFGHFAGLIH